MNNKYEHPGRWVVTTVILTALVMLGMALLQLEADGRLERYVCPVIDTCA